MTTAKVTLETGLGLKHRETAGIVFQPLGTADFEQIVAETEELAEGTAEETGTTVRARGRVRLPLADPARPGLRGPGRGAQHRLDQLQGGGYGDRLLAAVFAFEEKGRPIYFIYNFKRGAYYPFVPAKGDKARDSERELRLKAQMGAELPFEEDMGAGSRSGRSRSSPGPPGRPALSAGSSRSGTSRMKAALCASGGGP